MGMTEEELAKLGIPAMPTIGAGNARQPLGPPQGFFTDAAAADPTKAGFVPYIAGDEWVPAYSFTDEDRDRLKARMNAAGLYGPTGYSSGVWTDEDAKAYTTVLESANGMFQRDAEVVIDNLAASNARSPRAKSARQPLVKQVSNPDDIRAILRKASYDMTGSRLSDDEENRLISMYQGQQGAVQGAEYGAAGASGGSVTQEASPQNFAEAQIERMRPGEVATHRHLDAFEKILGSMGTLADDTPEFKGADMPKAGGDVL